MQGNWNNPTLMGGHKEREKKRLRRVTRKLWGNASQTMRGNLNQKEREKKRKEPRRARGQTQGPKITIRPRGPKRPEKRRQ